MRIKKMIPLLIFAITGIWGCENITSGTKSEIILAKEDPEQKKTNTIEEIASCYHSIYLEALNADNLNTPETMRHIVSALRETGCSAVDVNNKTDMVNYEQAEEFCKKAEKGEWGELTILTVTEKGGIIRYDLETSQGEINVTHSAYSWKNDSLSLNYKRSYTARNWVYTDKGYLFFEEYHSAGYDGPSGHTAIRIKPLDGKCREFNRMYMEPIGYNLNNMFLTDWNETDYGTLEFYDLFEPLYEMCHGEQTPYKASYERISYEVPKQVFEEVFMTFFEIDSLTLQKNTTYDAKNNRYQYRPRGLEECSSTPDIPYPEVTAYQENKDGTITLTADAVWPQENLDAAFVHEVTIRPLADGKFRYVSNHVLLSQRNAEPAWYTKRRSDEEWEKEISASEAAAFEKGYDLSIDETEKEIAENDCIEKLTLIRELYKSGEKGKGVNAVFSKDTVKQMADIISQTGAAVFLDVSGYDTMYHYEKMDEFLNKAANGEECGEILYEINQGGVVSRKYFSFDGTDMYVLNCIGVWNDREDPVISHISYTRMKKWRYTEKGVFCYDLCVPESPEVTEIVNGNTVIRVKPVNESYQEIAKKWLWPIGYQGNNLFISQWNTDNLEELDYNGLYDCLYMVEYQKKFEYEKYPEGIPENDFETLIMKYLPVSKEQLQKYAVYDAEKRTYGYARLGCGNYVLSAFGMSVPEITAIHENEDGTYRIAVDAFCEMAGNDAVFSHELTVEFTEDGQIRFLGNDIPDDKARDIPTYQYRIKR